MARQASLFFTISQSLLKLMSIESVMPSNHVIFFVPFSSCLQSFPASESFLRSQLFASDDQNIGVSASVLPMNIQDWLPLGYQWLFWSPCSPRDSQESSPGPQFKSINSSAFSLLYGPSLTSIRDCWKNHSFDYSDLCWQSLFFNMLSRFFIASFQGSSCWCEANWFCFSNFLDFFFQIFSTLRWLNPWMWNPWMWRADCRIFL